MNKKLKILLLIMAPVFAMSVILPNIVKANPVFFGTTSQTGLSTTTRSYIPTGGTATTTLSFDTYMGGDTKVVDKLALLVHRVATATPLTASTRLNIEYSHDGIDWYEEGGTLVNGFATSSKPFDLTQVNQFVINSTASSTLAGGGATPGGLGTATTTRIVNVSGIVTRYTRVVVSAPAGATSQSVWLQWVPAKQKSE